MNIEFTALIQKMVDEQGRDALLDKTRCKALLADYCKSDYQKERRLLTMAVEAGVPEALANAGADVENVKTQCVKKLQDEYFWVETVCHDVTDMLSELLTPAKPSESDIVAAAIGKTRPCPGCGKPIGMKWMACPWCGVSFSIDNAIKNKQLVCEVCGQELEKGWKICPVCGTEIKAYGIKRTGVSNVSKESHAVSKSAPNNPLVKKYMANGDSNMAGGFYDAAVNDYSEVLLIDANYFEANIKRGKAYLNCGDYLKAITDFNHALTIKHNDENVYNLRGNAWRLMGMLDKAKLDYQKALQLNPNFEKARNNLKGIWSEKSQIPGGFNI
jgi:tetratricopeptide (TPR) repeat protein